ncbi:MAG TPA: L-carnitine dehydrogenase [Burkholderiaceae bacterium]|nr:L-carnitine dehydrogenase [Rhodoferax sp.]MBP7574244.1 L-carnitine dehydrogenase [Rhodoferax sp.]HPW06925.1 L-carnitine dehydrogenase [Burkholderiaceae bacterium]
MSLVTNIRTFAALGSGVIGSGWIARALANGLDVVAWDPAPGAEGQLRQRVGNAWGALEKQGIKPGSDPGRLHFVATIEECVAGADFIQESAPERLDLKIDLHEKISSAARPNVLIASSTSGLLPSEFYAKAKHPERCVVGHPFNPVYLLPLVEVVGGMRTSPDAVQAAIAVYKSLGMHPLHVRKEVPGFIADRLLEAMWRESLHLVNDGIATTGEIDDAIRYGAGIRWSFMGSFLIYTLAGGDAGMRHFMAQFGPALKLPWTKLEAPELTEGLIDSVVDGTSVQLGKHSIAELERYRDDCLLAVQAAVKATKLKHGIALDE